MLSAHSLTACSSLISPTTLCHIVRETTQLLWNILFEKGYLDPPESEKEWLQIAKEFEDQWNFSHRLSAINEKHVNIQVVANSESIYFS